VRKNHIQEPGEVLFFFSTPPCTRTAAASTKVYSWKLYKNMGDPYLQGGGRDKKKIKKKRVKEKQP